MIKLPRACRKASSLEQGLDDAATVHVTVLEDSDCGELGSIGVKWPLWLSGIQLKLAR
jgi:hypothetical protein